MKLFLKVFSPRGVTEVDTGESIVKGLGIRGAVRMLKNRAFSHLPRVSRADCTTSVTYQDAHLTEPTQAPFETGA